MFIITIILINIFIYVISGSDVPVVQSVSQSLSDKEQVDPFFVRCFWIKQFSFFELWDLHTSPNEP
jgi:hypothetical protein